MSGRKALKNIHLAGTIWLMVCLVFVLAIALRQAGFKWWIIFSLSGHLALLVTLLVSLYLFAIFRGAEKGLDMQQEHPLTSTGSYLAFYVSAPLLGILAGAAAMAGEEKIPQFLSGIALGTFSVTFLTWVIADPLVTTLETLSPASREHRLQRLTADKHKREERRRDRDERLKELFRQQEEDRLRRQMLLATEAGKLAELLRVNKSDFERAERQAVDIGVRAWQIGGLDCMCQLSDMAQKLYKQRYRNLTINDYISNWWDGIGSWRAPAGG